MIEQKKIKIYNVSQGKIVEVEPILKIDAEWKKILTPEQFEVTTRNGTEKPFTCELLKVKEDGIYRCIRCGTDLFMARHKFESGTGWPSFFEQVSKLNVTESEDTSLGMSRTEVSCTRCGAHLGHVFNDGPPPTGKRYCINGVALKFSPMKTDEEKDR